MPDKINYYYEPTEALHKFDEVTACFINKDDEVELIQDVLNEVLGSFFVALKNALSNSVPPLKDMRPGDVGVLSNYAFHDAYTGYASSVNVWCVKHVETFIYSLNNKIYLEIAPLYPWHNQDPAEGDNFISFLDYMRDYKSLFVAEVPRDVAQQWLQQSEKILKQVDWFG